MTGAIEKELNEERITVEQYNKELEEAESQIEREEYYTHDEALEIFKYRTR